MNEMQAKTYLDIDICRVEVENILMPMLKNRRRTKKKNLNFQQDKLEIWETRYVYKNSLGTFKGREIIFVGCSDLGKPFQKEKLGTQKLKA